jgi:tellurite methyltransferase
MEKSFDPKYQSSEFYFGIDASEELVEYLKLNPPLDEEIALDIGCGEGRDSIFLAKSGYRTIAMDISSEGIKKLSKKAQEFGLLIEARCLDILNFNFPVQYFDFVNSVTLLDHLEQDKIPQLIKSIKRSVKDNGIVFLEVFTKDDPGYSHNNPSSECANFIKHYFSHEELISYFQDWEILKYEEKIEEDATHGPLHLHGIAVLIAKKLGDQKGK